MMHESVRGGAARGPRRARARWARVRVQTDEGPLVGNVRLESTRSSLYELLDDGRAYLGLYDVARAGSPIREEFLAIHKSAIRSVLLEIGAAPAETGVRER